MIFGTISEGTLRAEDLAPAFFDAAKDRASNIGDTGATERLAEIESTLWPAGELTDNADTLADCVDELAGILDSLAPPYCYFGTQWGDGADFGFWPSWESLRELPQFDGFPDTLPGDDFVVVNDHGNVSVYGADGLLLWDCV